MKSAALTALAALAVVSATSGAARAEPPWRRAGSIDLAAIPHVDVAPAPVFVRDAPFDYHLSEKELAAARPFDLAQAPRARFFEPRHAGAVSLVLTDNLETTPRYSDILRFFQQNPGAEPITAGCGGAAQSAATSKRSYAVTHDGDKMHLAVRHAWFSGATCKGKLLRAFDTDLTPVAGGLVFVYRTTCEACAPSERERLQILMPMYNEIRFTPGRGHLTGWSDLLTLGVVRVDEGASTFEGRFERGDVRTWSRMLDRPLANVLFSSVRIEVVRLPGEPLPVAQVFVR